MKQLNSRIHPGAIVLLHVVSSTNAVILDELLTGWEKQGYTFAYLSQLPRQENPPKTAKPSENTFTVNGKPVNFTAYSIGDTNYIKLRDMAAVLDGTEQKFGVSYDAATQAVQIQPGETYEKVGGELSGSANVTAMQAYPAAQSIQGKTDAQRLSSYLIDGANYIQLRELTAAVGCTVDYNAQNNTVEIETSDN